jgi:putative spermidine/putrescine transport system ATP-binding protein
LYLSGGRSVEYVVVLEDIVKRFGSVVAVDGISLEVKKGEFITLLGPSGSGKTTALMIIAGFQTPDSGKTIIEGEVVNFKPPFKRNIGMVFQSYALFPHMTVFDNIAFPLRMRRVGEKEISKNVERVLEIIKLPALGSRYPKQLSGGQQQRVALARALVFNPPVLLMDEPLGALDKKLREHMQLEIKHLHESFGISVIYVTHDQTEALTMSDRIAVMNLGRIEQIGSPNDLYEKPKNKFVADFIGETNLIDGEIIGEEAGRFELLTGKGMKILVSKRSSISKEKVSLAIRPERIGFVESPEGLANLYEGLVEEAIYLGDSFKYKILVDGKELLVVTQKNDPRSKQYKKGDRVLLRLQDDDLVVV